MTAMVESLPIETSNPTGAGRLRRRTAGWLALLAASLLTAACTPRDNWITAVFLEDGEPWVLFHPCKGRIVVSVAIYEVGRPPSTGATPSPATDATLNRTWGIAQIPHAGGITELRLLDVPEGWHQQTADKYRMTEFWPGLLYHVWADTDDRSKGNDRGVEFTLDDLAALDDAQVWAGQDPRAMTRDEFFSEAAASC